MLLYVADEMSLVYRYDSPALFPRLAHGSRIILLRGHYRPKAELLKLWQQLLDILGLQENLSNTVRRR